MEPSRGHRGPPAKGSRMGMGTGTGTGTRTGMRLATFECPPHWQLQPPPPQTHGDWLSRPPITSRPALLLADSLIYNPPSGADQWERGAHSNAPSSSCRCLPRVSRELLSLLWLVRQRVAQAPMTNWKGSFTWTTCESLRPVSFLHWSIDTVHHTLPGANWLAGRGGSRPVPAPALWEVALARRRRRRRSRRSRPRVPQPGSRLTWGPRTGRSGGVDPRRGSEGPLLRDAAMKACAARGPCRRRRSGNGRRGGGAGQVRAGRRRVAGPLPGRGSLPAQGSHCPEGSGAFRGAGARSRWGAAGKPRSAPGARVWQRPARIFARPGLPWKCSLCQEVRGLGSAFTV